MSRFPYHRRFHEDALRGMSQMRLELRGAYQTVLDLIYSHGGDIPDDDKWLAGMMLVSVRKWQALKGEMVDLGKIWIVAGRIGNPRAATELENQKRIVTKVVEGGRAGGLARAENARKSAENALKTSRKSSENDLKNSRKSSENEPETNVSKDLTLAPLGFSPKLPEPEPYPEPIESLSEPPSTTPPASALPPKGGRPGGVARKRPPPIEARPIIDDAERQRQLAEMRRAVEAEEALRGGRDQPATPAPDLAALQPEPGSLPQ